MNVPREIWKAAEEAIVAGDAPALDELLCAHAALFRDQAPESSWCGGLAPSFAEADARAIIAREHHFRNGDEFRQHQAAVQAGRSPVTAFEAAVEAVIAGKLEDLDRLLCANPGLIKVRSERTHHSTLLHYVGANGVEGWRQRTPANAVQIAQRLLDAGAEIDAMAGMYDGSTTLGLVATSIHPLRAGVQNELMDLLLRNGAAIDHPASAGNHQSIIPGCLANGRPGAAEFLANRGARLDLEGAAGVGRLDVVRGFFDEAGELTRGATKDQLKSGFQWACEYGRTAVAEFLLERGVDAGAIHRGQTGLHWAAYGGHPDIVRLILGRHVPANPKDESWGNTPLGWALHGWGDPPPETSPDRYHEIVELLIAAGATVEPKQIPRAKLRTDPRMAAAIGRMEALRAE